MTKSLTIDGYESIAAIRLKGSWRFFHDQDYMFLLDYSSYEPDYDPKSGEARYGTMIVDDSNIEQWMQSLAGELTAEQVPNARWENGVQVKLTFVIDFDNQLWVGIHWDNDQTLLNDFQPSGWLAIEDDVFKYVPPEVSSLWDEQLVKNPVIASINNRDFVLISPGTRAGTWSEIATGIDNSKTSSVKIELIQLIMWGQELKRDLIYEIIHTDIPQTDDKRLAVKVSYSIGYAKNAMIRIAYYGDEKYKVLGEIGEVPSYQLE